MVTVPVSRVVQLALMDFQAYLSTPGQDSVSDSSDISRPMLDRGSTNGLRSGGSRRGSVRSGFFGELRPSRDGTPGTAATRAPARRLENNARAWTALGRPAKEKRGERGTASSSRR